LTALDVARAIPDDKNAALVYARLLADFVTMMSDVIASQTVIGRACWAWG